MKRERCFLITQRRKLDFFPICCLSFSSERFCSRNINLCRRSDWSSQEVPKGQSLHLAEDTKPWQEQVPPKAASPLLNPQHEDFLFSPLCSEQCPSTEKTVQIQILIFFPSTITPAPNSHFFSRKMADELLKAKVHSSAITRCFLSSTGSTGPQPPRERGKTSLRNVVCHKLQLWPQLGNLGLSWEEDSKRLFSKGVTWQGLGHVKLKMLPKNDGLGTSTTAYPSPLLRSSSHSSADKKTSRTLRRTPF